MKAPLLVAFIALIYGNSATLIIKGPTKPVLEDHLVNLQCMFVDSDLNISQVHFEYFSKYSKTWTRFWRENRSSRFCIFPPYVEQYGDKLYLEISYSLRFSGVPFRCVSEAENVTAPDNSSESLTYNVQYLREPSLSMEGYSSYLGVPKELKVRLGTDVVVNCSASSSEEPNFFWQKEGSDWILASSTLTLKKISVLDEGEYTCMVQHPSVESLNKKRTISITVLPEDAPWYETTNGRLWLMTSAAAVALFVFVLSVSVFLCRRAKRIKTSKGPIDDRSQKKPIYKTSAESLPSTCGDKQPLV